MSFGLPPAGSTPAEEWGNKLLQAVDGALDQAGATASTGGFVDAAPRDQDSTSHDVQHPDLPRLTGGLASSVNVQSIANEAKLAKHSEGLTKEELLKGLSGREQAAAQLAAAQLAIAKSAPLSHEMPTAKTSSGPVDATRQIPGNGAIQSSPVEATRQIPNDIGVQSSSFVPTSADQTRDSVQHHQGNLGPSFIAQTVDERLAASQPLQGKDVLLVMQPHEPVPRDVVPSITSNSLATGSQNIHSQQAVPSQFQSSFSVPKQEPLQPKLPDLMPSRNIPVDTPMVEGLPGGWIGSLKTSVPGADRDHPETTVYQDVVTGLDTVGQTAFNAIPQSLKDSINPNRPHPGPSILDQARSALEQVHLPELPNVHLPQLPNVHLPQLPDVRLPQMPDLKGLSSADNRSRAVAGDLPNSSKPDATRSAPVAQPDSADLVDQARNMASDLLSGTRSRAEDAYHAAQTYADKAIGSIKQKDETSRTAPRATPSTTLPLEEKEVQRPGDHTAGVGALPGTIDEAGVAVLPLEKNPGQGSTDKAVAAKEPGPEQSATDGVLDVSGGGQSISAAKADRVDDGSGTTHGSQPNAQLDAIVSDREVRKDTVEPGQNVGQTERLSTLQPNNTDTASATVDDMAVEKETYQDKQGPIGAFGEETAQGGQREPIDSYEKKTVQEDKRDPVESSFSGLNITTGASAPSSAASAPSGGFALAPPLGVFTETTPVASGASVILPGTVLPPAKREPPVEILPVQESQIPEPMLGRPAADPSIAFEDVTPRGNLELHNETLEATSAIATRERRMDAPEAVLGDSAFGSSAAAPEAQEKDHDVPSYLSSRATSTHESIPSGKLDQPSAARMDSSASVTAVKHGHLGDHHHRDVETPRTTLDTVSEKALPATPLQDEKRVVRDADNVRTSPAVTPTPSTPSNVHKPVQVGSNSSNPVNTSASQHQRTDSAVSSSSKKKGFFSKLKDKLHHDDK